MRERVPMRENKLPVHQSKMRLMQKIEKRQKLLQRTLFHKLRKDVRGVEAPLELCEV